MLEISNLALPLDAGLEGKQAEKLVRRAAARALNVAPSDIAEIRLLKRSVDARKKHDVHFVATLGVELAGGAQAEAAAIEAAAHRKGAANVKAHRPYEPLRVPQVGDSPQAQNEPRPIVVGTGPAGLFCALYLARAGLRPTSAWRRSTPSTPASRSTRTPRSSTAKAGRERSRTAS